MRLDSCNNQLSKPLPLSTKLTLQTFTNKNTKKRKLSDLRPEINISINGHESQRNKEESKEGRLNRDEDAVETAAQSMKSSTATGGYRKKEHNKQRQLN